MISVSESFEIAAVFFLQVEAAVTARARVGADRVLRDTHVVMHARPRETCPV
jgi:hypothetical protein